MEFFWILIRMSEMTSKAKNASDVEKPCLDVDIIVVII